MLSEPLLTIFTLIVLIGFEVLTAVVVKSFIFWDILVTPLAYSSTLKIKMKCSSETSVNFQRTTRYCIPEDRTLPSFFLILSV
jgi:hypothetical protein